MALPYIPTTWLSGDIVSSARLNKLEGGVKENSDAILENTADVNQLKSQINEVESGFPQKSASGAIVTIDDGADNVPVVSLEAEINPVQDLHGYDSPWPAGGGVNLLPLGTVGTQVINGITWTMAADGRISAKGTATADSVFTVIQNDTRMNLETGDYNLDTFPHMPTTVYTIGIKIGSTWTSCWGDKAYQFSNASGYIDTFWLKVVSGGTVDFNVGIVVSKGTTPPAAFSPYSNICPISGRTGANVFDTGVNVWDEEWEQGGYDNDGAKASATNRVRNKNPIPVVPSTAYYAVFDVAWVFEYDADGNFIQKEQGERAITVTANTHYISFMTATSYGGEYKNDLGINYPSSDHSYHAYTGRTVNISWETEAGTVYGGSLTLNQDGTADITPKFAGVDMGTLVWSKGPSYSGLDGHYRFTSTSIVGATPLNMNRFITSYFNKITYAEAETGKTGLVYNVAADTAIRVETTQYSEVTDFVTAITGQKIVYELATPVTYHIENVDLVKTLYGLNNIWADTGDVSLTYRADPATYTAEQIRIMLNAMVATVEPTTTASKAYNVNDFLIYNNVLYKVIANIANGGTITPNTNVSATTVGAELTAILNA